MKATRWSCVWGLLLVLALSHASPASRFRERHRIYRGYSVEAVEVHDEADKALVRELEQRLGVEVWEQGQLGGAGRRPRPALLMVAPGGQRDQLTAALDHAGLTHHLYLQDVASAFEEYDLSLEQYVASRGASLRIFEQFPRHQQVNEYLDELAAQFPSLATVVTAGQSFEGRDIKYLKLSTTNFEDTSKPVILFQAMIHAREWLTTPCLLYAAHSLLVEGDSLLDRADFILLPVVNPDGYEFSQEDIRLWRKTRSVVPGLTGVDEGCVGSDGNRNYDVMFGNQGTSIYHCSDTFPGVEAFSEPETRLSRDIMLEHGPQGTNRMEMFVDVHSHGSWVLFSYGNGTLPPRAALLLGVGGAMAAAMDARKLPEGDYYTTGNSAALLYATSGTASDYAQSIGVPLSFTLELPNYGRDFRVPPEYLPHVTAETWAGLRAAADMAATTYAARNIAQRDKQ